MILLPALLRGKERHCSRRLLRKSKLQHLRVARVRAASSTSWMTWGLAGTRGGLRSPARGSTHRSRCRFSLGRSSSGGRWRAPTVTGRLRPGPGGSNGRCIMQDVLDRLGLLLYRRELLDKALDGVAEQPRLGDGGVEEACLVDVLHLCQIEPEMALLDHHGGHRLPEGPCCDFCRLTKLRRIATQLH